MSVEFGPLPPVKRDGKRRHDWAGIAAALKARPGEWAKVAEDVPSSVGVRLRTGRIVAFKSGGFESTTRSVEGYRKGYADVWARYVGTGDES